MDLRDDSPFWEEASEGLWSFFQKVGDGITWIWMIGECLGCLYWLISGLVWIVGSVIHTVFFVNP